MFLSFEWFLQTCIIWRWNCTKAGGFGRCAKVGQDFHHVRRARVQQCLTNKYGFFLDKVTKVHAIGLMLDDRWMYQKIEGCLLVYFLCRDGRSFRVPALPSLKRTVGRLGPCPNDGYITCISHHWIQTARRKYLGKVRCETLWNCPNFCQVSTRDIWIQATTAAPGVWGVLLGW